MRVISGIYRGRKLNPPKLLATRPTTDFAREGLFNMLHHRIDFEGLEVLDLYAGTGAISMEFLSRGAASATAIDSNRESVRHLARIKNEWQVEGLEIFKGDAVLYLEKCNYRFGLIFADPPYQSEDALSVHKIVMGRKLISDKGMLIIEHDRSLDISHCEGFQESRAFGKVNFSFFALS